MFCLALNLNCRRLGFLCVCFFVVVAGYADLKSHEARPASVDATRLCILVFASSRNYTCTVPETVIKEASTPLPLATVALWLASRTVSSVRGRCEDSEYLVAKLAVALSRLCACLHQWVLRLPAAKIIVMRAMFLPVCYVARGSYTCVLYAPVMLGMYCCVHQRWALSSVGRVGCLTNETGHARTAPLRSVVK